MASTDANARVKKIKFFALKPLEDFFTAAPALAQAAEVNGQSAESQAAVAAAERKLQEEKHDILVKMRSYRPAGVSWSSVSRCRELAKPRYSF